MDKTIIISDVHLGSDNCQAKSLCNLLENETQKCNKLILNGDMFESMDFRRLKKHHWNVLSLLRKISDKMEVIWICGNHDSPAEIISHLLGIEVTDDYEFISGDKKILVLHGHIFDNFLNDHPFLTFIGDLIYNLLQKIDKSHHIARLAKHNSKQYLRCAEIIKNGAIQLAKKKNCQIVCCGHTHNAIKNISENIHYYNSGCWTEKPSTYLFISNGNVELIKYEN